MPQVLVADDDSDICETVKMVLEDEGWQVILAQNAAAALGVLCNETEPIVALIDASLRHNGITLIESLAADPHLAERHAIIVFSGHAPTRLPVVILEHQWPILSKPFGIEHLIAMVEAASVCTVTVRQ